MKITRRQLRKLIRESVLQEDNKPMLRHVMDWGQEAGLQWDNSLVFDEPGRVRDASFAVGKEFKRAFSKFANYSFLNSLNTVHWAYRGELMSLIGKGKDELSTTPYLPGEPMLPSSVAPEGAVGLLIKGRITLATNNMDAMISKGYHTWSELRSDKKSSGLNKLPTRVTTDWDFNFFWDDNKPVYILDKDDWKPAEFSGRPHAEALVDNWVPKALVVSALPDTKRERKRIEALAQEFGVPIVDVNGKMID